MRRTFHHRAWGARLRITVVIAIAFAVVLTVLSVALLAILRVALLGNVDQANARRARDLGALVNDEVAEQEVPMKLPPNTDGIDLVQVLDDRGTVVASSPGSVSPTSLPHVSGAATTSAELTAGSPGGTYRLWAMPEIGPDGRMRTVIVGRSVAAVDQMVTTVAVVLIGGVPLLTGLVAVLTWVAVARSLRPVEAIRQEFSLITGTDLHRRVPHPGTRDELGALAETLNETIGRLENDVASQRRFTADAAHELRSPLAALTAQLELAHNGSGPPAQNKDVTAGLLQSTRRLEHLVDDLLVLARHDSRRQRSSPVLVDLDPLVLEETLRASMISPVPIDTRAVSSAQVRADAGDVQRVVRNLLDNAARHAHTQVAVGLHEHCGSAVLTVDDDGPGVPPDQRQRIFERFTRLDEARDRRRGGTGLGLAISHAVITSHRGSIEASDSPLGGARFTVTIPAAHPDRSDPALIR